MNEKTLTSVGMTLEQSKVYLFLLSAGMAPVKVISAKTGIGRALSYKVLKQLIKLHLVTERQDIGKISYFSPNHPQKIKQMFMDKKSEIDSAKDSFEKLYGKLTSDFNMLLGKPNIQFYEGRDGLERVYEDILEINQDIQVISSPVEENRSELLELIREQIRKQKELNIRTKAITPLGTHKIATPVEDDDKHLITRKIVPSEKLKIPAQIIIYGDKVAITNFKEAVITVQIESKYIAETFRIMFDYIWKNS